MSLLQKFLDPFRGSPKLSIDSYMEKLESRGLGPDGRQVPDPVPMSPPIGYRKQPSMFDIQRQMIRDHLAQYARDNSLETLEDFEDFEVGDEPHELTSGYENDSDPPLQELLAAGREAIAERQRVAEQAKSGGGGGTPPPPNPSSPPPAGAGEAAKPST